MLADKKAYCKFTVVKATCAQPRGRQGDISTVKSNPGERKVEPRTAERDSQHHLPCLIIEERAPLNDDGILSKHTNYSRSPSL